MEANSASRAEVIDAMLSNWNVAGTTSADELVMASDPEANRLVKGNTFAFLLACSIDKLGKSFLIFNTPQKLYAAWGHLDPQVIKEVDPESLANDPVIKQVPSTASRLQIAKSVVSVAKLVVEKYAGRPESFFDGNIAEVQHKLQEIHGVGPGIARMIIIIRLLYFGLEPLPGGFLLPKQDVHINRVFKRSGLIDWPDEFALMQAMMGQSPRRVAILDQVAWNIGINFCRPSSPICFKCPINEVCRKIDVV